MDKYLFEIKFNFTNTDLNKISTYISDYYKNSPYVKKIKNLKYGFLFTSACFICLDISYLLKKQFDLSSLIALITTFLLLLMFLLIKNPIKKFIFYFKKRISTNLIQISITDSILYLEAPSLKGPLKESYPLNSLSDILFYDDILILIFKKNPLPIKLSSEIVDFKDCISFLKSKIN